MRDFFGVDLVVLNGNGRLGKLEVSRHSGTYVKVTVIGDDSSIRFHDSSNAGYVRIDVARLSGVSAGGNITITNVHAQAGSVGVQMAGLNLQGGENDLPNIRIDAPEGVQIQVNVVVKEFVVTL
ncbi:hypothetical protein KC614_03115 [candidate division WWE3 bacterium]|uniref:Uncharacterized protein n=1 Tax=candidate division WWE3 bacterium TaxID=2053526 RepID=A0A955RR56_UNCKA|nr:hypothetical protein [candidate division WWE3 bacterium]